MPWSSIEHRGLADRRRDGHQRPFDELPPPRPFLRGTELGVAGRIRDAARGHDPRRPDAKGDRDEVAQQRGGNPGALQLFAER